MDKDAKPDGQQPVLNFIRDEASSQDEFGSHTRIATAIATVIRTRADLKVIGLLGPWGSGKSTVLKIVEAQLDGDKNSIEPYCFPYDAWLHQNDPPRRSFLETLIQYLIQKKLPTADVKEKWKRRLDELNRRVEESEASTTPMFTTSGRLVIWSLFLLPLAAQFLNHSWFEAAFSPKAVSFEQWAFYVAVFVLLLPLLLVIAVYLSWRPWKSPLSLGFWREHRAPHENESALSLIMNKEVHKTRNRITREPDPTTIEFQNFFREIMHAVSGPNRRFIFIIDNLDRLPEVEAVAMWGTIRSFFLGAHEAGHIRKATNLPTVILPVDEDAVRRMYKASHREDADALAASFMDKTFDLTFRVTRPVLSDWHAYLSKQMREVFGEFLSDDWPYVVGNLYEKFILTQSEIIVTPRTINTLVNSIALLWLQWRSEGVRFPSIAYYAIYRKQIDGDILKAIATPLARIEEVDPEWQQAIAALHYGVSLANALQVHIEQPLRKAISERKADEFKKLAAVRGFDRVLQRILESAFAVETTDPFFVFGTALLLNELSLPNVVWINRAWYMLCRAIPKSGAWKSIGLDDARAIDILLSHSSDAQYLIEAVAARLNTIEEAAFSTAGVTAAFIATARTLLGVAKTKGNALPRILVPGGANVFLTVVSQCADDVQFLAQIGTAVADEALVSQLSTEIADQSRSGPVAQRAMALIARDKKMPWTALITAAGQVVENQNANYPGMSSALSCLGLLRTPEKAARAEIKRLADGGQLSTRLNEAHNANIIAVEAQTTVLLMLTTPSFPTPAGIPWDKILSERTQLVSLVDEKYIEYDKEDNFDSLISIASANNPAKPLIRAVASLRVREERLGALQLANIIENLSQYLECIDEGLRDSFISKISTYKTFWDKLAALPLNANVTTILHGLIRSGGDPGELASDFAKKQLNNIDLEVWAAAIRNGSEPFPLAESVAKATGSLQVAPQLFGLLEKLIAEILATSDVNLRTRWFQAARFISASARQTLYSNMQDRITSGVQVAELSSLLTIGGDTLLEEGGFGDEPDGTVRHVIFPLLSNPGGMDWLISTSSRVQAWIIGSKEATRAFLSEQLHQLWKSSDETGKGRLQKLQVGWSLPDITQIPEARRESSDPSPEPSTDTGKVG